MNHRAFEFAKNWSEPWFGFWAEQERLLGVEFDIENHVDASWNPKDKDKAISYLRDNPVVLVAQRPKYKCGLCDELLQSSCYHSDGVWLWTDELAHLVYEHNFVLPDKMLLHMREKNMLYLRSSEWMWSSYLGHHQKKHRSE